MKILFISPITWEKTLKQRPHFLGEILSEKYEVIFFEAPGHFPQRLLSGRTVRKLGDNLTVVRNDWAMPYRCIPYGLWGEKVNFIYINRMVNEWFLRKIIEPSQDVVVVTENYMLFDYPRLRNKFNIRKIIYDCVDLMECHYNDNNNKKLRLAREEDLVRESDYVVVVSKGLEEKFRAVGDKVIRISNGVDFPKFEKALKLDSEDIMKKVRKGFGRVLGYIGAIEEWFDFEVLDRVLQDHADIRVVLIGIMGKEIENYKPLRHRFGDRFEFIGTINHDLLPLYIKYFDLGLIPFNLTHPIVKGVNPIKLYEYFAMGKSVIANIWNDIALYHDNKKLIDFESYIYKREVIEKNIDENTFHEKIEIAESNCWKNKVNRLIELIG